MPPNRSRAAFTLVDVTVALAVVAVLVTLAPAASMQQRNAARRMTNSTQLRGIHQACVFYAQGNKSNCPGLAGDSSILPADQIPWSTRDGRHAASRFALLLIANAFTPEYMINPADSGAREFEIPQDLENPNAVKQDLLTVEHFSYAVLAIDKQGEGPRALDRRAEWSETINTMAVVLSDRNTGPDAEDQISSPWTDPGQGVWRGTVVHNDNSTMFETSPVILDTQYSDGPRNERDHLFKATGPSDALMSIYRDDRNREVQVPRDRDDLM